MCPKQILWCLISSSFFVHFICVWNDKNIRNVFDLGENFNLQEKKEEIYAGQYYFLFLVRISSSAFYLWNYIHIYVDPMTTGLYESKKKILETCLWNSFRSYRDVGVVVRGSYLILCYWMFIHIFSG